MVGDFPYYFTSAYSSDEYTEIYYNFQYIKYASDDGYFSKNLNDLIGMYFSDMYFIRKKKDNNNLNEIGVIILIMIITKELIKGFKVYLQKL